MRPAIMILAGFGLSLLGVVLPLMMVMHVLASTFFLNFFSYTASMTGLILGITGAASYVRAHKK
jgi:hypothetical protein